MSYKYRWGKTDIFRGGALPIATITITKIIRIIVTISRRHFSKTFRNVFPFDVLFGSAMSRSSIRMLKFSEPLSWDILENSFFSPRLLLYAKLESQLQRVIMCWRKLGHKSKCSIFSDICGVNNLILQLDDVSFQNF